MNAKTKGVLLALISVIMAVNVALIIFVPTFSERAASPTPSEPPPAMAPPEAAEMPDYVEALRALRDIWSPNEPVRSVTTDAYDAPMGT
ncbi:hypothetical protein [Deinococcus yavapaiensis]|uniref:Uncharacterized protein n=1 Tax=Deinococcus yavapaiensis KR-236 TaxID=694435 RepID=A0A318SCN3_9DEIO|nr:hypothetical protein [Deinococcus yavapaiensis]PYE49460.1 hypothetical protein DES52_1226 [Deinococcus yavapaiensis KR-236]